MGEIITKLVSIKDIEPNRGQIDGLPKNPRFIKDKNFEDLVRSIEQDPEMLELREVILYPYGKKFVVIAGNMRHEACKHLGHKSVPAKILPESTTPEKLRAYAIKDNVSYGQNDWDLLANEWDSGELLDWGMEIPDTENDGDGSDLKEGKEGHGLFPLSIILMKSDYSNWQNFKKSYGVKGDTEAFVKLFNEATIKA